MSFDYKQFSNNSPLQNGLSPYIDTDKNSDSSSREKHIVALINNTVERTIQSKNLFSLKSGICSVAGYLDDESELVRNTAANGVLNLAKFATEMISDYLIIGNTSEHSDKMSKETIEIVIKAINSVLGKTGSLNLDQTKISDFNSTKNDALDILKKLNDKNNKDEFISLKDIKEMKKNMASKNDNNSTSNNSQDKQITPQMLMGFVVNHLV